MSGLGKIMGLPFVMCILSSGAAFAQQPVDDAQPPPVTGLVPDHAAMSVENLELESEWYERVLGFRMLSKSISNGKDPNWHLTIPGYRLDMIKRKGSTRPALTGHLTGNRFDDVFQQQGWIHVSFHVKNVAAALKTLQALHVNVKVKKEKDVPIQIRFNDPEGNEVEVRRNLVL